MNRVSAAGKEVFMHKTLMGTKRTIRFPFFFIKTVLLGLCTSAFFVEAVPGKGWLLLLLVLLNVLLLRRDSFKILKFLLITTTALVLVWFLLFFLPGSSSFSAALTDMLHSGRFRHAFLRLWGLFAAGQLYIGTTSQYEMLLSLKRVRANINISLFVVILFNALSYFIRSFKDIRDGFKLRIPDKRSAKDNLFILNSLMFDAISTIFECRKAFFLNSDRIYASLSGQAVPASAAVPEGELHFRFSDVSFPPGGEKIIRSAQLDVSEGITLIAGSNGSGKTTLLNLVSGIIPNVLVASFTEEPCSRESYGIGYVMQGVIGSFFYDTVRRALMHVPEPEAKSWLERFGMLYLYEQNRYISELSAGECKVVMLLAELLDSSRGIFLLDEPSAFLAEGIKGALSELILFAAKSKRILMISHEKDFIDLADRLYVMADGVLTGQEQMPAPMKLCAGRQTPGETLTELRIPQPLLPESTESTGGEYVLRLRRGESIAVLGRNGAGKTTLGTYLCRTVSGGASGLRCVMMRQDLDKQFFTSTVEEELLLGTAGDEGAREKAKEYLTRLGMNDLAQQPPQFLSGGQKRMLLTVCLLMQEPDVLILDEPFDSLDELHAQTVLELICEYRQSSNCACVFIDQTAEMYEPFINGSMTLEGFQIKSEVTT